MLTRRIFLRLSSLSALPTLRSATTAPTSLVDKQPERLQFVADGPLYAPDQYIAKLQQINQETPSKKDAYGRGGTLDSLNKTFAAITGKEAAMCMPSGTLANQLAVSVLSGQNTKVFVQETSHLYHDESDAAQAVFGKRLIPLAPGKAYFTLEELQRAIELEKSHNYFPEFESGIGTIALENPVRGSNGQYVPLDEIKKISSFCREKGYRLHLDGARIYMAAAQTGVSVAEYASYFDTIYISLYKYLGAASGAMLCGPKAIIDQMPRLVKIHGGVVYTNWANASMALYHLAGIDDRLKRTMTQARQLFTQLNELPGLTISPVEGGTNVFTLRVSSSVNFPAFRDALLQKHNILIAGARPDGTLGLVVNDGLLGWTNASVVTAFRAALAASKV